MKKDDDPPSFCSGLQAMNEGLFTNYTMQLSFSNWFNSIISATLLTMSLAVLLYAHLENG